MNKSSNNIKIILTIISIFIIVLIAALYQSKKKELRIYKLYYLGGSTEILKDSFNTSDNPYISSFFGSYSFNYNKGVLSKDIKGVVRFKRLK